MTLKLRNLLFSMMILYSSLPSSMMWRRASNEGMFARMALRHTGSPSCDINIFSSLAVMASYRTIGSSYSSGDVKWSWGNTDYRFVLSPVAQTVISLTSRIRTTFFFCYLMQFEGHPHPGCHDSIEQVHIRKHPFVPGWRDTEVSLEECVEAIEKRLQAVKHINRYNSCILAYALDLVLGSVLSPCRHAVGGSAQGSSSQDTQPKTEVDQGRISFTSHWLQHNGEIKICKFEPGWCLIFCLFISRLFPWHINCSKTINGTIFTRVSYISESIGCSGAENEPLSPEKEHYAFGGHLTDSSQVLGSTFIFTIHLIRIHHQTQSPHNMCLLDEWG